LGDLENQFAQGQFTELGSWLRRRVYQEGSRYPSARLIEFVTGSPPDHHALLGALRSKYARLYRL
jgi:carboxypeptidase Taq